MISLIFALIFFILFIFLLIFGFNHILRSMVDHVLNNSTEHFIDKNYDKSDNDNVVNPVDDCSKIDILTENRLNFQTATNIPLSPNSDYVNYVGNIYSNNTENNENSENNISQGNYCLKKSKLLYDGIWNPIIENNDGTQFETWTLTNGNLTDGYYCSNKLLEVNKPIPKDFIDKSATPPIENIKYYTYFNDIANDKYDTEIACFPSVFNAGITEDLKKKY